MRRLLLSLLFCCCGALYGQPKALFYMTDKPESIRSFFAHARKIDLLVPTWYSVDGDGLVTGAPNPAVLEAAHGQNLPVMPIVALFGKRVPVGLKMFLLTLAVVDDIVGAMNKHGLDEGTKNEVIAILYSLKSNIIRV